ncbi:MAG: electron transport complex subunit RsxA [Spirochaetales bacterium]|nr:electron transport complex subunit RsxA [Spirochaetales bacterium]
MQTDSLMFVLLQSLLINNFVLAQFLGLCSFIGVSTKIETAWPMGAAVTLVMFLSSLCAYGINLVLVRFDLEYLRLISYIAVIASMVQLVEMTIRKISPTLFRLLGIYLPLIATNCAILGMALFQTFNEYNLVQGLVFSIGAGLGYMLALVLMAGLREKLRLARLPGFAVSAAVAFMLAGLLSMAFMGFAGLGG